MKNEFNNLFHGIRAVVFDFDGVILESANIKTEAFLELFAAYPDQQAAVLAFHLENLGVSRYVKFRYVYEELLARPYTPADEAHLGAEFSDIVMAKILACPFVPGALALLAQLQGRGIPAFVASGTPQAELEHIVAERGLASYFGEVWGTPHQKADILRDLMARFGWQPRQVLMVGDGMSDYEAARAAATPFVARQTPEQDWAGIDVPCVPDLQALPGLLALDRAEETLI